MMIDNDSPVVQVGTLRKVNLIALAVTILALVVFIGFLFGGLSSVNDAIGKLKYAVEDSEERHSMVQVQLDELREMISSRPEINIKYGTVYNTDGEVVIQNDVDKKSTKTGK